MFKFIITCFVAAFTATAYSQSYVVIDYFESQTDSLSDVRMIVHNPLPGLRYFHVRTIGETEEYLAEYLNGDTIPDYRKDDYIFCKYHNFVVGAMVMYPGIQFEVTFYQPPVNGADGSLSVAGSEPASIWLSPLEEDNGEIVFEKNWNNLGSGAYQLGLIKDTTTGLITTLFVGDIQDFVPLDYDFLVDVSVIDSQNGLCNGAAVINMEASEISSVFWSTGATDNLSEANLCPGIYNVSVNKTDGTTGYQEFAIIDSDNQFTGTLPPSFSAEDTISLIFDNCELDYNEPITDAILEAELISQNGDIATVNLTITLTQSGGTVILNEVVSYNVNEDILLSLVLYCSQEKSSFNGKRVNLGIAGGSLGLTAVSAEQLTLYPNPATGNVSIKGAETAGGTVFDGEGREVLNFDYSTFDVSNLKQGVYFVKLKDSAQTLRFIRN